MNDSIFEYMKIREETASPPLKENTVFPLSFVHFFVYLQ